MLERGQGAHSRWCFLGVICLLGSCAWALEIPAEAYRNLASEEFRDREAAQEQLLNWANERPEAAKTLLFEHTQTVEDPEIRERCLAVLRELVLDEYEREGKGYIGIRMQDELTKVPDDPELRGGIRVIEVVEGSAADEAGLLRKDLIVGLNDQTWRQAAPSLPFSKQIQEMKPRTEILLKVVRQGELIDVRVKLGRRPDYADQRIGGLRQFDLEKAERAEKDAYFRKWLERRKLEE